MAAIVATSGTVGQTSINTATLIEHAIRRAGVPTSDITPEITQAARNNLYFLLVSLSNMGVNLWTVDRYPVGLVAGTKVYNLPVGTIDVLSAVYRSVSIADDGTATSSAGGVAENAFDDDIDTVCTQTSANGNISYNFGASDSARVVSVGVMTYGDLYLSLIFESSSDGITWHTAYEAEDDVLYEDRTWTYYDIPNAVEKQYFRVRETNNGILIVRALVFGYDPVETTIGRLNQDMYDGLSNKDSLTPNRPVNYLLERLRVRPTVTFWPVPDDSFKQVVFRRYRNIQDVGTLTDEVEVPQRWMESLVNELAIRMIMEIPGADMSRIPKITEMATIASTLANGEERDNSPVTIVPNISCYSV